MDMGLSTSVVVIWAILAGTGISTGFIVEDPTVRLWGTLLGSLAIGVFFWKIMLTAMIVFYSFGVVLCALGAVHSLCVSKGWLR